MEWYAASWLSVRVTTTPYAIIAAPERRPTSSTAKPVRRARDIPAGPSGRCLNEAIANVERTTTSSTPPTASAVATALSKGVSRLKCDGTPRHAWRVMPPTSSTQSAANRPSSTERARAPMRRYDVTHATAISVRPKETPKVNGLRQETGPVHGPPSTKKTPRWKRPAAIRTAPVT
ncbi:hypothetical protein ACFYXH_30930 [Streptomyces sp. NPDC002730]|uniref:hypothetical protein n=1 Tax=Streptomyces sp. NPDC002730 TaxID=3364662 RepID=UPI003699E3D4